MNEIMDMHFKIFGAEWYFVDTQRHEPKSVVFPANARERLLLFSEINDALDMIMENPDLFIHKVYIPKEEGNVIFVVKIGENGVEEVDISGIMPQVEELPIFNDQKEKSVILPYACYVKKAMVHAVLPNEWYVVAGRNHDEGEKVMPYDCLGSKVFLDWEKLHKAVRNSGCNGKIFKVSIDIDYSVTLREHVANARNGEIVWVEEISPQSEQPMV